MKVAVVGCAHGELETIYDTISYAEKKNDMKVDLILCCGDFQAVRNQSDLLCMAVPQKYREMGTFHKYYSGAKEPPALTIFIGGNHEASNYLAQLPYGGWVSPNIFYLGYAGVVNYGGLRIGGVSGIYKKMDYRKGHYELPPYSQDTLRSAYHVRNLEIFRLLQLQQPLDIMLSHDWPKGIYNYGDWEYLVRRKRFLEAEVNTNTLGSPVNEELLEKLRPSYWFSAHLHVKFTALVQHQGDNSDTTPAKTTKFLALDKCLPHRKFLQIIDIPSNGEAPFKLSYDAEWLSVLQATNHLLRVSPQPYNMPFPKMEEKWEYHATEDQMSAVKAAMAGSDGAGEMTIREEDFARTASAAEGGHPRAMADPQTRKLCTLVGLTDPFDLLQRASGQTGAGSDLSGPSTNPDQIDIDSDQSSADDDGGEAAAAADPPTSDLTFLEGLTPAQPRSKLSIPPPIGNSGGISLDDQEGGGSSRGMGGPGGPGEAGGSSAAPGGPAKNDDEIDLDDNEDEDDEMGANGGGGEEEGGDVSSPQASGATKALDPSEVSGGGEIGRGAGWSGSPGPEESSSRPVAEGEVSSPLKKMRRRNYQIYTPADEEEETID